MVEVSERAAEAIKEMFRDEENSIYSGHNRGWLNRALPSLVLDEPRKMTEFYSGRDHLYRQ